MNNLLITREEIIKNYIAGYNTFNIEQMVQNFDDQIIFENIQDGAVTLTLTGLPAFTQQAEQAKAYFSKRMQTVKAFHHAGNQTEIEINYWAVLGMDFPNGLKTGQELHLTGKSIFQFAGNRIIRLTDIS